MVNIVTTISVQIGQKLFSCIFFIYPATAVAVVTTAVAGVIITKVSELESIPKEHQVQFLVEWPIHGLNPLP